MHRSTVLAVAIVLIAVATTDVVAQRRGATSPFQVGQKVEVRSAGDWQEAEVERILPNGWVQVRMGSDGSLRTLPPDRCRPSSAGGGSTAGSPRSGGFGSPPSPGGGFGDAPSSEGDFKVGDRVEVELGGLKQGVVEEVMPGGVLRIRLDTSSMPIVLPPDLVRRVGGGNDRGSAGQADSMRTWTDSTGKFQVQARFVRREGDQITIEQEGGKQITLPLDRLSPSDQAFVNALGGSRPEAGAPVEGGGVALTPIDNTAARQIELSPVKAGPVAPDGISEIESLTNKPISMGGGGKPNPAAFSRRTEAVVIHRPTARAFVSIAGERRGMEVSDSQVVCFDLKKGKVLGSLDLPTGMRAVDLSPDGKRMLVLGPMMDDNAYVWDLEGGAKMAFAWRPYPSGFGKIDMAAFLDDRHVVTAGGQGILAVWDIEEKRAVYTVTMFSFTVPAVSPGRKQIALATKEGIFLIDALAGTPLATLPGEPGTFMRFCFRDDGRQLAGVTHTRMQIWDLETAERTRDIYPVTTLGHGPSLWLSPNYILVNGTDLVDLERRVVLWKYRWSGMSPTGVSCGGLYWTMMANFLSGQRALVAIKLPHPEAEQIANAILPEKILALKPGSAVTVRVTAGVSGEDRQVIQDALVKRLTDNGIRVVDGADLVLSAETAQGTTEEVSYHGTGGGGTAQVTQQISLLKITEKGRELWKVTQVKGAPMFISYQEGESIQSAIAERNKPTTTFFVNTPLPQYLARAGEDGTYGESTISADGIKPVQKK